MNNCSSYPVAAEGYARQPSLSRASHRDDASGVSGCTRCFQKSISSKSPSTLPVVDMKGSHMSQSSTLQCDVHCCLRFCYKFCKKCSCSSVKSDRECVMPLSYSIIVICCVHVPMLLAYMPPQHSPNTSPRHCLVCAPW